jgi:hypothetical protein
VLNVPIEPTRLEFGSDTNTTVDVLARIPEGWNNTVCGDQFGIVARDAGGADGLVVAKWRCTISGDTIRFSGPGEHENTGAAVRFLFRAAAPAMPAINDLSAGFFDLTQTYRDGEQQRRRGAKQLQVSRPGPADLEQANVDLPPDWIAADCAAPSDTAKYPVTGWACQLKPGAGAHPTFRVHWERRGGTAAKYFYFHAYTKEPVPTLLPLVTAGVSDLRDLMFDDGQIPTVLISNLRPAFRHPVVEASPTPIPGVNASCAAYAGINSGIGLLAQGSSGYGGLGGYGGGIGGYGGGIGGYGGGIGGYGGYGGGIGGYGGGIGGYGGGVGGYGVGGYAYGGGVGGYGGGIGGYGGGIGGYGGGIGGYGGGIGGIGGTTGCQPPPIVVDPCFASAFTTYGNGHWAPLPRRPVPASCSNVPGGTEMAVGPPHPYLYAQRLFRGKLCIDRNAAAEEQRQEQEEGLPPQPALPPVVRPVLPHDLHPHHDRKKHKHLSTPPTVAPTGDAADADPSDDGFRDLDVHPGGTVHPASVQRADRGEPRQPLHRLVDPTPPPVVMMAPDQAGPGQGVPPGASANVVLPPNPTPAPTIQAFLPQQEPQVGAGVPGQAPNLPFCDQLALPDAGSHSPRFLRMGLMMSGVGASLVTAAVYVRRRVRDPQWFMD